MKLINEQITIPVRYTIPEETEGQRNALAKRAVGVKAITNAAQLEVAGAVAASIRIYLKDVEKVRVDLTAPLLVGQRLLKSICDDHVAPLDENLERIEGLAKVYNDEEKRRVAEAERIRAEGIAKAEADRVAAVKAAEKANAKAHTEKGYVKAVAANDTLQAAEDRSRQLMTAPALLAARAKGQSVKKVLKWEVIDLAAVYKARPELCKLEIKPSAVNAVCVPEIPVPGLKMSWDEQVTFSSRGAAPVARIQQEPLLGENAIDVSSLKFTDAGSSQIKDYAYEPEKETLHLRFHRGGHYSYAAFPPGKFEQFKAAPSKGMFLGQEIKGKHEFTKLS